MKRIKIPKLLQLAAIVAILSACNVALASEEQALPPATSRLVLWYDKPADSGKMEPIAADPKDTQHIGWGRMTEALPLGGGKFGGLVYGAPQRERVVLNDSSFWTGREVSSGNYDLMGSYQMLGELLVDLPSHAGATGYRRALDIGSAIHTVGYTAGGTDYLREAFASHQAGVMVFRFTANKAGALSGTVVLRGTHKETTQADAATLAFSGTLPNDLKYETKLVALHDGGTLSADNGKLLFSGCDTLTLIVAAGTNYVMDYERHYRGEDPHTDIALRLAAAKEQDYAALKAAHISDYRSLFDRVGLDLGAARAERCTMPTDRRKNDYAKNGNDPELEALGFQYGRYLMISCSRPGGVAANMQGLWCDSNNPPWHSDYHADINIHVNYWPTEPANLDECYKPLFDLITSQLPAWRKATATDKPFDPPADAPSRGWSVRHSHGINGDQGWKYEWNVAQNAWYCQHFWSRYQFTGDKAWLKAVAYPVIKEVCEFWEPRLKRLADGTVVIPHAWSPEHGPVEDGVSYAQEMVWDLFNNYVAASEALDVDADYRAKIAGLRDALLAPKIGKWGQLQEWMVDRDDPNDHQRCALHFFAVYPGAQITPDATPALAAAAKVSLEARGVPEACGRDWCSPWRTALYARLRDGDKAHEMLHLLISTATYPNMLGIHPPMAIDANFGLTAAVCEMLMQSHAGMIELLPALPVDWPSGNVTGLRARGGFTVNIAWKDGKVTTYRITSQQPQEVKVRVNGETKTVHSIQAKS